MSFERNYLKQHFPDYDYRNPLQPWRLNYHVPENRVIVNFQLQAFVFWWAKRICQEDATVGLAIGTANIPFCLSTWNRLDVNGGHIFSEPDKVHLIFSDKAFPLIVASSPLFSMACLSKQGGGRCDNQHIIKAMKNWGQVMAPGGVLVATIPDSDAAKMAGISIEKDLPNITHAWSPAGFYNRVIVPLSDIFEVEEFDTLKNNFAFNIVLRRK